MKSFLQILIFILLLMQASYAQYFWEKTNGLDSLIIYSLAINSNEDIFAGTDTNGVFRSTDNGNNWTNLGLMNLKTTGIVIKPSGEILLITLDHHMGGGVFRSTNNGNNWIPSTFTNAGTSIAINSNGHIFVGTLGIGVFRSTDNGENWVQINQGLTDPHPNSLLVNTSGDIFAGTMFGGVFRSTDNGENWIQVNQGLTYNYILSLAINSSGDIFAGTASGGVFRSTDNGGNWVEINQGLTVGLYVYSFAINSSGDIFAGTSDGVFRSTDNGENWIQINQGLTNIYVNSLAINSNGDIFAGTADGVFRILYNTTIPIFSILPTSKDFGEIITGLSSADQTFTITNVGGVTLTINGGDILLTGTYAGQFELTDSNRYPINLGTSQSAIVKVKFSPTSDGSKSATLRIVDNITESIHDILLTGTGVTISIPYAQGFEGTTFPPGGWTNYSTKLWEQNATGGHLDTKCARVVYTPAGTANLQSPSFTFPTNPFYRIKFWWKDNDIAELFYGEKTKEKMEEMNIGDGPEIAGYDTTYLEITTNGGTSWTVLAFLSASTPQNDYVQVVQDLNSYAGQTVSFRWRDVSDGSFSAYGTGLDDVALEEMPVPIPIWANEIIVKDAGGTELSKTLTIGQDPNATDSIDSFLGEYELPPLPPTGIFDARFNLPTSPLVCSLIDYRDSAKTEIIWTMTFQPGSSGYPMTFIWDSTSFPEGTFYLKDLINGSYVFTNMKNQSSYTLTEPAITSLNIIYKGSSSMVTVNNEWNMISVPLLAEDMSVSNLFPTATSLAYGFDYSYVTEDTLVGGKGYWLKFDGNQQIQIFGSRMGDTVPLETGWNMFGVYEEDIPISQITTTPPGIIATYFFGFNNGYEIADTLKSGQGYWVRVTTNGTLNLNSGGLLKDGEQEQFVKIDKDWGRVIITDNKGKSTTLYATEEETELSIYELPPMPPTGIFDARYSSGRLVENLSNEKTIQISSDNYPITIKAEELNLAIRDMINGELLNEELKNGEELRITNNKITSIEVSGRITGGLPISYELFQNYPNPFNPSTTIRFSLPQATQIKINLFNILGEQVATIAEGMYETGNHKVTFNASNLPSGAYIYRIESSDFVQVKKMILIK